MGSPANVTWCHWPVSGHGPGVTLVSEMTSVVTLVTSNTYSSYNNQDLSCKALKNKAAYKKHLKLNFQQDTSDPIKIN